MSRRATAGTAALALLALPALAGAASRLVATNVRIGDHPAFVRVVVDFNGKISIGAVDAGGVGKTTATVRLLRTGVTARVQTRTGEGVRVALQPGTQMLHISASFAPHRFKYLSYAVVTATRLAIDLWKSAPPATPSHTCSGLTLDTVHAAPGLVSVTGHERGIFEHQFQVVVRGKSGTVLGRKSAVRGPGAWAAKVHYRAARRQTGTVEAVAFSAKDGSVECIAQTRATLRPS